MSDFLTNTRTLQTFAGVEADGIFGPTTAEKLVEKLQLSPGTPGTGALRVCVDPGHGMGNRRPGLYDPGCQNGTLWEAGIVLTWAEALETALHALGAEVWMTRRNAESETPVATRASRAFSAGCTVLISIHVNDAEDVSANGCETLFSDDRDFAQKVHQAMARSLNLRDRGTKPRSDLAVLKFNGLACLLELGFIHSTTDMAAVMNRATMEQTCEAIAKAIVAFRR